MKSMEQFGKPLVSYEGAATIGLLHQGGELTIEGYFEAAQFLSGRVAVSVVPINTSRPQKIYSWWGPRRGNRVFGARLRRLEPESQGRDVLRTYELAYRISTTATSGTNI